jgi:hypothetical protein
MGHALHEELTCKDIWEVSQSSLITKLLTLDPIVTVPFSEVRVSIKYLGQPCDSVEIGLLFTWIACLSLATTSIIFLSFLYYSTTLTAARLKYHYHIDFCSKTRNLPISRRPHDDHRPSAMLHDQQHHRSGVPTPAGPLLRGELEQQGEAMIHSPALLRGRTWCFQAAFHGCPECWQQETSSAVQGACWPTGPQKGACPAAERPLLPAPWLACWMPEPGYRVKY